VAAKYRRIDPRFWRDEKVQKLRPLEKLIAMYCFTGPETNRVGIYPLSVALGAELTGLNKPEFVKSFVSVNKALSWQWDLSSRVIYLPTWWKYNQPENRSHLIGCLTDTHDVPSCGLMHMFFLNSSYLPLEMKDLLELHRTNYLTRVGTPVPPPVAHQELEQKQEQEQKKKDTELDPSILLELYQAHRGVLPEVRDFSEPRKRQCLVRLKKPNFADEFKQALVIANQIPFLSGRGKGKWKASFDWFIGNEMNVTKVLEGTYGTPEKSIGFSEKTERNLGEIARGLGLEEGSS
jgi:hypothetical protein